MCCVSTWARATPPSDGCSGAGFSWRCAHTRPQDVASGRSSSPPVQLAEQGAAIRATACALDSAGCAAAAAAHIRLVFPSLSRQLQLREAPAQLPPLTPGSLARAVTLFASLRPQSDGATEGASSAVWIYMYVSIPLSLPLRGWLAHPQESRARGEVVPSLLAGRSGAASPRRISAQTLTVWCPQPPRTPLGFVAPSRALCNLRGWRRTRKAQATRCPCHLKPSWPTRDVTL